jgi:hypothetical protein
VVSHRKDSVHCKAKAAMGSQCKRNTIIYADKCWQHTRRDVSVKIDKSTIPSAGKGLSATRELKKSATFGYARNPRDHVKYNPKWTNEDIKYILCNSTRPGSLCTNAKST